MTDPCRHPISPSKRYLTDWRVETFLWFAVAAVICLMIGAAVAHAHDAGQFADSEPATRAWYKQQFNSAGQWCCDKADGHAYFGDYQIRGDGSARLEDGTEVPKSQVLTQANPTGHAVWWFIAHEDGSRRTYCFAPGPQG